MKEETISSERLYEGRIINLRKDTIKMSKGLTAHREIIEHAPAVVIIPFQEPNTVYFIKQFRLAARKVMLEMPAGIIDPGEDPLIAAKRELLEETGITASSWTSLGEAFPTPGFCEERFHFYLAESLTFGDARQEADEHIELVSKPLSEVAALIDSFAIDDAKTLITCMHLLRLKGHPS